jgi:hypothetical protein
MIAMAITDQREPRSHGMTIICIVARHSRAAKGPISDCPPPFPAADRRSPS